MQVQVAREVVPPLRCCSRVCDQLPNVPNISGNDHKAPDTAPPGIQLVVTGRLHSCRLYDRDLGNNLDYPCEVRIHYPLRPVLRQMLRTREEDGTGVVSMYLPGELCLCHGNWGLDPTRDRPLLRNVSPSSGVPAAMGFCHWLCARILSPPIVPSVGFFPREPKLQKTTRQDNKPEPRNNNNWLPSFSYKNLCMFKLAAIPPCVHVSIIN